LEERERAQGYQPKDTEFEGEELEALGRAYEANTFQQQ
jgi:hypothetical protein